MGCCYLTEEERIITCSLVCTLFSKALPQALPEPLPHQPAGTQAESLGKGWVSESPGRSSRCLPEVTAQMLSAVHQPSLIGIWAQIQ